MGSTRRCARCGSESVELEPEHGTWWCTECGGATPPGMMDPAMSDFTCPECGQFIEHVDPDNSDETRHVRADLAAPRCSVHKAELVRQRRAAMQVVK